jgi:hypothetical protein
MTQDAALRCRGPRGVQLGQCQGGQGPGVLPGAQREGADRPLAERWGGCTMPAVMAGGGLCSQAAVAQGHQRKPLNIMYGH